MMMMQCSGRRCVCSALPALSRYLPTFPLTSLLTPVPTVRQTDTVWSTDICLADASVVHINRIVSSAPILILIKSKRSHESVIS